ncbi:MAG: nickel pincer cofactor biosynthesis protein LarC [Oscillospiraceae bacterium]|nr:nickel pincer cofactor biosynthesis protein LarC [Oscillospiraceae bacterium]
MRTLYLDCGMGAAGDMLTAALLELHDDPDAVLETLNRAFAGKAVLSLRKDEKCGISGSHLTVTVDGEVEGEDPGDHGHGHHHSHTSITEVRDFIGGLDLPADVIRDALSVYDLIAAAEAKVHGHSMENIHFHEVGTLDAMADVVSVCTLIHALKSEKILASPVHVGSGTVRCAHGLLPVPAPATQELLKGIPIYSGDIRGELCTPTGAALLKHFVNAFGSMPPLRVSRIGYGTGFKDFPRANVVRALLGESEEDAEQILELACNIDDMTAEELAFAQEWLFAAGALDVYFTSIGMKKNRPGVMLACMCRAQQREEMLACLFRHTTSLGVREYVCNRYKLSREFETRKTPYGPVRIKRSSGYGVVREKAEFEDLKKIAEEQNLSLREVKELIAKS